MPEFNESMRYDYPLNKDSIVWSVGGYKCVFENRIHDKYGCAVDLFEPIKDFMTQCKRNAGSRRIYFHEHGVGAKSENLIFYKNADGTGFIKNDGPMESVEIKDIAEIMTSRIDLLKINIEGMEYDLIDRMVETGIVSRVKYIQVQFHSLVPDSQNRHRSCKVKLHKTHKREWSFPWIWESWELR